MSPYRSGDFKPMFLVSQMALLLFFLLQLPARYYPHFHPDLVDGVRGLFLGIAIGGMVVMAWRRGRPLV